MQLARVLRHLEDAAATDGADRLSLRAAIDSLPPPLRNLARTPTVAAALTDYAGDYGATPEELALSVLDEGDTAVDSGEQDRVTLAEPVDDRLWLAGEAQHPTLHSTVHGAWLSGRAAAEQVTA